MIIASNGAPVVAPVNDVVRPDVRIDTADAGATRYWAYRLSISQHDLNAAVDKVGPSVAAVRRYLGK
ncbi:DUF3606 domain-containing protein [Bradyrhizobium sp. U87765 SZCCT0131]|nr:DUF3606 domain-containing protein [Bradyrhizobium sp. U87765 SZCCT0131]MBR1262713.1 DUF3606 domain-containing protein [Bradyrhizobium sp. U87765 SZCCT0134]MBR1308815.1 DUF3606 domain-containing protein [Bradyrhizobium sp. U87765 SZCCT0110]MBR1318495.1 DUF3606 domain-containing protein [Bradyrhizobium sp. U87765 SZCCT0109]MBR1352199.1 DUF3606 domain-containing protein [Bradyrhizobium sp. U87765 SZCCT0048]